jgi:hypothetical protein
VLGVSTQESKRSCICVLGVSSQEREQPCIYVLGVISQEFERVMYMCAIYKKPEK